MLKIASFCVAIALSTPLWSQVVPAAMGGSFDLDDTQMMTPPPVNNSDYPINVGSESRSNFISGGLVVTAGYSDNILAGVTPQKVGDTNYFLLPTITIDRRGPRQSESLTYSAGFSVYQKTSSLNGLIQEGRGDYRFHISRHAVLNFSDNFRQNSNVFNQGNPFSGGGVSGGSGSPIVIQPNENQMFNTATGGVEYQYARNAMIGGSGSYTTIRFPDLKTTASGEVNSDVGGASGFYSRRISRGSYVGAIYQFAKITTHPVQTYTDTHTVFGFYTLYLTSTVSLSVLGGPQHYDASAPAAGVESKAWSPAVEASIGWQNTRSNITAGYSHIVSNAGGLAAAYHANTGAFEARRQFTRRWNGGVNADYQLFKNLTSALSSIYPGGHSLDGSVSVRHSFRENLIGAVGYSRFHQSYHELGLSNKFPDSNRVFGSITYQFLRPLGR